MEAEGIAQRLMGTVESASLWDAIAEGMEMVREAEYYCVRYEELCPPERKEPFPRSRSRTKSRSRIAT